MRRTDEQFKAELLRRRDAYEQRRAGRRKKALHLAVPLMVFLVCVSVLYASLASRTSLLNGAPPEHTDAARRPQIVSVDVEVVSGAQDMGNSSAGQPFSTEKNEQRYTDPKKVAAIADYFASLTWTKAGPDTGESPMFAESGLLFSLTDETGAVVTYTLCDERVLQCGDGRWTKMGQEDVKRLKALLAGMRPDR